MTTKFCRHIRTNGERCGSPALRSEAFCYYHDEFGKRHRNLRSPAGAIQTILHPMSLQDGSQRDPSLAQPKPTQLDLPPLEDRHSIQLALSLLITALAQDRIDPKRAALLFYGLQVASSNAHLLNPVPKRGPGKVSKTILDEVSGELIAPDEDPEECDDYKPKDSATKLMEKWDREDLEEEQRRCEAAAATGDGFIPPPLL